MKTIEKHGTIEQLKSQNWKKRLIKKKWKGRKIKRDCVVIRQPKWDIDKFWYEYY